jgi:hypothetical protein
MLLLLITTSKLLDATVVLAPHTWCHLLSKFRNPTDSSCFGFGALVSEPWEQNEICKICRKQISYFIVFSIYICIGVVCALHYGVGNVAAELDLYIARLKLALACELKKTH